MERSEAAIADKVAEVASGNVYDVCSQDPVNTREEGWDQPLEEGLDCLRLSCTAATKTNRYN